MIGYTLSPYYQNFITSTCAPFILEKKKTALNQLYSSLGILGFHALLETKLDIWGHVFFIMEIPIPGKPVFIFRQGPGGRLNIKMPSYQYRDSHVKDKTVSPTVLSLTWESPYLGKTVFILRRALGAVSIRKTVLPGMAIPMLKIRRPIGRLIFNMEITIRR